MKILAVMGSPKGKGNGYKAVQLIEKRMNELGAVDFEYLFLKDTDLQPCKGCFACVTKGEDKCPLKDSRPEIERRMKEADGLIFSSPTYVLNVSGLMKNFIDRFAYTNHRPEFHRQKVMLITNSGGSGMKESLKAMGHVLGGMQVVSEVAVNTPPWPITEKAAARNERAVKAGAEKLYAGCRNTALPKPGLYGYVSFLIQKGIGIECREWLPADYAFYADKAYYYDTPISPVTKATAGVMTRFLFFIMKDMGPGTVKWPASGDKK
jgi:multimeric flavodoxin WrbA